MEERTLRHRHILDVPSGVECAKSFAYMDKKTAKEYFHDMVRLYRLQRDTESIVGGCELCLLCLL